MAAVDIFCPDVAEVAQTGGQLGSVGVSSPLCSLVTYGAFLCSARAGKYRKGLWAANRAGSKPPSHPTAPQWGLGMEQVAREE